MATTEPIRNVDHVHALYNYFLKKGEIRNNLLIVMAVHTALRIGDLLSLKWDDVYDFTNNSFHSFISVREHKTGKSNHIPLHPDITLALNKYMYVARPGVYLFSNPKIGKPISRVQAHRIIRHACEALKLPATFSCHSLRKTFGYHAWKTGVPPVVIMDIYNHVSFAVTQRYLGITQDDRNDAYLQVSI
ncbi:MAG: tyrosine-type recombinase/integrase [Clostridiales bacterium]|jgi:integrase|nr:tyrosine-type recombinase/integrase [Clostridiales bacterium]